MAGARTAAGRVNEGRGFGGNDRERDAQPSKGRRFLVSAGEGRAVTPPGPRRSPGGAREAGRNEVAQAADYAGPALFGNTRRAYEVDWRVLCA